MTYATLRFVSASILFAGMTFEEHESDYNLWLTEVFDEVTWGAAEHTLISRDSALLILGDCQAEARGLIEALPEDVFIDLES